MPLSADTPKSILLVCLGNICRSPTAEAIFRQRAAIAGITIKIDSAGTSSAHVGEHPDIRAQKHAKEHGYNIAHLIARQVTEQDFNDFDLILAMDSQNLEKLEAIKTSVSHSTHPSSLARLALLSAIDSSHFREDVPDPYYGSTDDFDDVISRIETAVDAWIDRWMTLSYH